MTTLLMFPGQSSLSPEMLREALERWPAVASAVLTEAERQLDDDLSPWREQIVPRNNRDVQLGVFLTSHIHLCARGDQGDNAVASLGLSLGEYNHLVHIGALGFADALTLVAARGDAYDRGPEGRMAAIFPIGLDELEPLLERASQHGVVEAVNLNSPTQTVIAGDEVAVEAAVAFIEEETFAMVRRLSATIPMHCSRFRPVVEAFRVALERAPWRTPRLPYRPNVAPRPIAAPTPAVFVDMLCRHVCEPVRWREAIDTALAAFPDGELVEVGPGRVLVNLLREPWAAARHRARKSMTAQEAAHGR